MTDEKLLYLMEESLNIVYSDKEHSYKSELMLLTIKSLLPSFSDLGVDLDYKRFRLEIFYWAFYRTGDNPSLINSLKRQINPEIYFNYKDDSLLYRILPIVFVNENFSKAYEELTKSILFTTGNPGYIIENILLAFIAHRLINGETDKEKIIQGMKDFLINLSQKDFANRFNGYYRLKREEWDKTYIIEFEKSKIQALNLLNNASFKAYEDLGKLVKDFKEINMESLLSINLSPGEEVSIPYFQVLAEYMLNLRNSRIDPDLLKIDKYILPDIFKFNKGDVFYHSIFNKTKLIDKVIKGNFIYVEIATKSGKYCLKKPIAR